MAAIEKDKKSPDKLSMSAQRIENKNRRKKLSGTYWSLGSEADMKSWEGSLTTDYQNQFKVRLRLYSEMYCTFVQYTN